MKKSLYFLICIGYLLVMMGSSCPEDLEDINPPGDAWETPASQYYQIYYRPKIIEWSHQHSGMEYCPTEEIGKIEVMSYEDYWDEHSTKYREYEIYLSDGLYEAGVRIVDPGTHEKAIRSTESTGEDIKVFNVEFECQISGDFIGNVKLILDDVDHDSTEEIVMTKIHVFVPPP